MLLLLPGALRFISLDWVETIVNFPPLPAAGGELTAATGVLVIAAYGLVPLIAGAVKLRRREA